MVVVYGVDLQWAVIDVQWSEVAVRLGRTRL